MIRHPDRYFPTDYDTYAPTYAWARRAYPWVLQALERMLASLPPTARALEIGCGTGNYVRALAASRPGLDCVGFDRSEGMLRQARALAPPIAYVRGDAGVAFPFPDQTFHLAFAVDVIHHVDDVDRLLSETGRTLAPGGRLAVVTDSEDTLKRRSLTRFFPETYPIELARYPAPATLHAGAVEAGLELVSSGEAAGYVPLDDGFVAALEAQCSSSVRLTSEAARNAGMARVHAARERGEQWYSCYLVLEYTRPAET